MNYSIIEFTKGWDFQAYQEVSDDGTIVNLRDFDGNLLATLSSDEQPLPCIVETKIIDPNPPKPIWGT